MRIRTDDILFRVDRTWLGPKVLRFPWRATYQAYAIGIVVMAAMAFIGFKIGLPVNVVTVTTWVVSSLIITHRITRALDPDRPIRAALVRLGQELTASRPVRPKPEAATNVLTADRWRYGAAPEQRRLVRWALAVHSAIGRTIGPVLMRIGGLAAVIGRLVMRRKTSRTTREPGAKNRPGKRSNGNKGSSSSTRFRPLRRSKIISPKDPHAVPEEGQEVEDRRPDIYSATR